MRAAIRGELPFPYAECDAQEVDEWFQLWFEARGEKYEACGEQFSAQGSTHPKKVVYKCSRYVRQTAQQFHGGRCVTAARGTMCLRNGSSAQSCEASHGGKKRRRTSYRLDHRCFAQVVVTERNGRFSLEHFPNHACRTYVRTCVRVCVRVHACACTCVCACVLGFRCNVLSPAPAMLYLRRQRRDDEALRLAVMEMQTWGNQNPILFYKPRGVEVAQATGMPADAIAGLRLGVADFCLVFSVRADSAAPALRSIVLTVHALVHVVVQSMLQRTCFRAFADRDIIVVGTKPKVSSTSYTQATIMAVSSPATGQIGVPVAFALILCEHDKTLEPMLQVRVCGCRRGTPCAVDPQRLPRVPESVAGDVPGISPPCARRCARSDCPHGHGTW